MVNHFYSALARQFSFATKTLLPSTIKKSTKTLILIYFIRFSLLLLRRQLPLFCFRNRLFGIFNALSDFEHHLAVANCNMWPNILIYLKKKKSWKYIVRLNEYTNIWLQCLYIGQMSVYFINVCSVKVLMSIQKVF